MRNKNRFHLILFYITILPVSAFSQEYATQRENIISRQIGKYEKHVYPITLEKKSHVELIITARNARLTIDITDPVCKKIKTFNQVDENKTDTFSFIALVKGDYQIRIIDSSQSEGEYQVNDLTILSKKAYRKKRAMEDEEYARLAYGGTSCGICFPTKHYLPHTGIVSDAINLFFTR